MEITKFNVSDLKSNPNNVRKHSEKQINEYARSVKMFGQIRPLVVDEAGVIWCGNGLFQAINRLGWKECDCYVIKGLTDAQKNKLMLADNKVYELGATDFSNLDQILLDIGDFDVPGFDENLLKMIADSAKEADEAIVEYGRQTQDPGNEQESVVRRDVQEFGSTAAQLGGGIPYEPPKVISHPGAEEPTAEMKRYVVCPKCGEKIWL